MSAGTYYYMVEARDAAGNTSNPSNEASVTVAGDVTAPTVSISNPTDGAQISGTISVAASAADDVGVSGVQFKLDGSNLGSEVTSAPYSTTWDTTDTANGSHILTAVARDATGNTATSSAVTVTVNNSATAALLLGSNTIQQSADNNPDGEAEAFAFTARASGVAGTLSFYVDSGSSATSLQVGVYSDVDGQPGTLLTNGTISSPESAAWNTVTLSSHPRLTSGSPYWIALLGTGGQLNYRDEGTGSCSEANAGDGLTALPETWSSGTQWASCNLSAYVSSAVPTDTTPPSVPSDVSATSTLPTQATVSWTASTDAVGVIGYHVWRGDSVIATTTSTRFTDSGLWPDAPYSYTVSAFDAAGNESARSAPASVTTLADTNPPSTPTQLSQTAATETTATLRWHASTDDVAVTGYQYYGATDSPLGTTPDTSVTYTGLACGTSYVVGIVAFDEAGNLSPEATTTLTTAACGSAVVTLDKRVTWHQFANRRRITSPPLTTAQPGELVVAFIGSDGPATIRGVRFSSVTGGGLSWTLRKRVNTRYGTSEIWTAPAFDVVANMTVTATRFSGSYVGSITVAAFRDASLTGVGATGGASATSGAPSASLLATETGSVVWGVGNDWDRAVARTQGVGQTVVDQFVSSSAGCTFWVQRRNATSTAGQTMTIRDRAPTSDQWNLATIEIVPAGQSNA